MPIDEQSPHDAAAMGRSRRRLAGGAALLALSAVLPFFPPAATPLVAPAPDADLLARLFPGVPAFFVLARLAALSLGAGLAVSALPPSALRRDAFERASSPPAPQRRALGLAFAIALVQLASGLAVTRLGRIAQAVYVLASFVPAVVLWLASRQDARSRPTAPLGGLAAVALIAALWLLLRVPPAWHSPGVADSIDTWLNFGWLEETVRDGSNLLTSGPQPGVTNLHLVFLGVPLIGPGRFPLTLGWMQVAQAFYSIAAAGLVAAIVARLAGRAAALVAAALLLFSPFTLSLLHVPTVFAVLWALISWTLWLALRFHVHASLAALACLGVLGGIATTIPQLAPFGLVAGAATLGCWLRGPRLPWMAWAIASAGFVALALPGLPTPATFAAMREAFLTTCGQWAGLEAILLGQTSPYAPPVWDLWQAGRPGPADIALGNLLAPFATPRTALRLWADVYLEPFGAAAAALGIAQCVRSMRRDRRAALLLGVLFVALLPGVTSAYDRASLTRAIGVPLVMAVFAGIGFEALRRALRPRQPAGRVAGGAALAIAISGIALFDCVNPRLLPRSSIGIALRVLEADPAARGALVLVHGGRDDLGWLHVERIARYVPPSPLPTRRYEGPESLAADLQPGVDLLFYSPGLDADRNVTGGVCAHWPDAALYTFFDEAGLSRVLAARPDGAGWTPRWPPARWHLHHCATKHAVPSPAGS